MFQHSDIIDMRNLLADEDCADIVRDLADQLGCGGAGPDDYAVDEYAADAPDLIADGYFEEYAREIAEEVGDITGDERWPLNHIDWSAAARELQHDYSRVVLLGRPYWVRSF